MTDIPVEADRFGATLEQILGRVETNVNEWTAMAVHEGAKAGAKAWRRNIRSEVPDGKVYRARGKTHTAGAYAKSIRTHKVSKDPRRPISEVGSPKMPGLAHLLEMGHARIGGGRVRAIVHIAPAADEAFEMTGKYLGVGVEEALNDL